MNATNNSILESKWSSMQRFSSIQSYIRQSGVHCISIVVRRVATPIGNDCTAPQTQLFLGNEKPNISWESNNATCSILSW